jgi:hypothetical protein
MTFVRRIAGVAALGLTMLIGAGVTAPAQAGYMVTLTQQDIGGVNTVVATGSGPIDLTGLSFTHVATAVSALINPQAGLLWTGVIRTGPMDFTEFNIYTGIAGPTSFGSGNATETDSDSGDVTGISGSFGQLFVPNGYSSDDPLSNTSTYFNKTFSSLGVTPGTYEWTWGTGPNQNFTLDIEAVAAPEPSSLALLGDGLGLLGLVSAMTFRRRSSG